MAASPSHKLGQMIGEMVENAFYAPLHSYCSKNGLYLDRKGDRPARKGKKLTWVDGYGNSHDLDFVIERGGSDKTIGTPVAFIEAAWRRYTKHSRNKAQEIQGALIPLYETYRLGAPFLGALLSGVFTEGSLKQLKSRGFELLYFPYDDVVDAFGSFGVDISFNEKTQTKILQAKVNKCDLLGRKISSVGKELFKKHKKDVESFIAALDSKVQRTIRRVIILPLFGDEVEFVSVQNAIADLPKIGRTSTSKTLQRYDTIVEYGNGACVIG